VLVEQQIVVHLIRVFQDQIQYFQVLLQQVAAAVAAADQELEKEIQVDQAVVVVETLLLQDV
tara:strand:+ start:126 stop:311 length:186 start_codon:yes stop_codon:yes gene_type:complete